MDQSSNGDDSSHKLDANVTEKSKTLFETNRRASFGNFLLYYEVYLLLYWIKNHKYSQLILNLDNESIQIGGRSKTDGQYEEIKSDKRLELLENIYNNQKEQSNQMEHAMMKEFIGILKVWYKIYLIIFGFYISKMYRISEQMKLSSFQIIYNLKWVKVILILLIKTNINLSILVFNELVFYNSNVKSINILLKSNKE